MAIIDSGTTQLVLNTESAYNTFISALQSSNIITWTSSITSSDKSSFWQGSVGLPTGSYTINTNFQMSIQFVGTNGGTVSIPIPPANLFNVSNGYIQFTGVGYDPTGQEGTIVGETLFTGNVVFFDRGAGNRIGFAPGTNCFGTASAAGINVFGTGANVPTSAPGGSPPTSPPTSAPSVSPPTSAPTSTPQPASPTTSSNSVGSGTFVGAVALAGSNGCDYTAPVVIGGSTYNLIIDSGSSNFAIATTKCTNCASITPSYSGTLTSTSVSLQYGSGSFSGDIIDSLTFTIGGLSATMNVIGITSQSSFFTCNNQAQGIMGLAYQALSQDNLPVAIDALAKNGVPNGFALQLCAGLSGASTASKTGNMWIGGYDSSFTTGAMQYVQITNKEWYGVQVNGISVGGTAVSGLGNLNSPMAIIDSGTTQLVINNQANYNLIIAALQSSNIITWGPSVSSSSISSFWQGNIAIPSGSYSINTKFQMSISFLGTTAGSSVSIAIPPANLFDTSNGYIQFTGIGYDPTGQEGTIVGETLFTNYVVFFDRDVGSRIGFAPGTNCFGQLTSTGINEFATPTNPPPAPPSKSNIGVIVGAAVGAAVAVAVIVGVIGFLIVKRNHSKSLSTPSTVALTSVASNPNVPPLPEGWKEEFDPKTNKTYYVNISSGATQWERPLNNIN